MKKRITIILLVAVLLSALLVAPAFSQKLGYKEPDNRPSYVQHWFERVTTTCPSCGQSVTYNSTSDNFFINGKLDHTENYGGGYVCPFCGYRSW